VLGIVLIPTIDQYRNPLGVYFKKPIHIAYLSLNYLEMAIQRAYIDMKQVIAASLNEGRELTLDIVGLQMHIFKESLSQALIRYFIYWLRFWHARSLAAWMAKARSISWSGSNNVVANSLISRIKSAGCIWLLPSNENHKMRYGLLLADADRPLILLCGLLLRQRA